MKSKSIFATTGLENLKPIATAPLKAEPKTYYVIGTTFPTNPTTFKASDDAEIKRRVAAYLACPVKDLNPAEYQLFELVPVKL